MKLNYSEPKIYTGGVDISTWSQLSKSEKEVALSKDWFVYFSFRSPESGKLKKQPFIKAGVNKLKSKRERHSFLKTMQRSLLQLLEYGFNPYKDNTILEESLFSDKKEQNSKTSKNLQQQATAEPTAIQQAATVKQQVIVAKKEIVSNQSEESSTTIEEAITLTLELKVNMMNKNSFVQYKSRIGLFEKWLKEKVYYKNSITFVTKKIVIQYLNDVLKRTSARNRNNSRTDIASMFQLLEDNEIVKDNFVRKIAVLKSVPKRNKTYTKIRESNLFTSQKRRCSLITFCKIHFL
jgi:hypothetical protein